MIPHRPWRRPHVPRESVSTTNLHERVLNACLSPTTDGVPTESPDQPDDSQTSAKQVLVSNEPPDDIESQPPLNQAQTRCDKHRESTTGSLHGEGSHTSSLHLSFEDETATQTPCRGPQTRITAICGQTQLTECFHALVRKEKSAPMNRQALDSTLNALRLTAHP